MRISISLIASLFAGFLCLTCNNPEQTKNIKEDTIRQTIATDTIPVSEKDSLQLALDSFLSDSALQHASVGIMVAQDSLQNIVLEHNAVLSLVPASVIKLIITSAALEILGENRRFATTLQYQGEIVDNHILHGNIIIKGGGDPTLGSHHFPETNPTFLDKWVSEITDLGIDSITGSVIGDASVFNTDAIPITWSWGEICDYYCTAATGIAVYDNQYKLKLNALRKGRYTPSVNEIEPYIPDMVFENSIKTASIQKELLYIIGAPYQNYRLIKGEVPSGKTVLTIKAAIPDPAYIIASQLCEQLQLSGIAVNMQANTLRLLRENPDSLYTEIVNNPRDKISKRFSPTVAAIVKKTNMKSNNLFAEHLLKHIGIKQMNSSDTETAVRAIMKFRRSKELDNNGMYMFDGSGISRYNAITVRQLVETLLYMKNSSFADIFHQSLPIAGESGTLRYFCKDSQAHGKISAKSGSMSRVRSYAGFINTESGKQLTFAIIINNYSCKSHEAKKLIEKLLINIVNLR